MKVNASSAIGTVTVSSEDLQSDPVLQLVLSKAASPLQLKVVVVKKKATTSSVSLELLSGVKLNHRNAILRCICGMGMHNALDGRPQYLMGGHASPVSASPHHAMALASLTSWMSAADQARTDASMEIVEDLLDRINSHLTTRAFLVDSPSMTLADIDVAAVLSAKAVVDTIVCYPHVHRWMWTIQEAMRLDYGISLSTKKDDTATAVLLPPPPNSQGPPVFYYGDETDVAMPLPLLVQKGSAGGDKPNTESQPKGASKDQQQKGAGGGAEGKKGKKEAKAASKQQEAAPAAATTAVAEFDVSALDIRVGQITKVWHHPESEKLFCEEIDLGEDQPRQIASGLRAFYETADLEGRRVVVLCNLKKRNLVGFPSHGMVLCASNADHTAVECMEPPADAKVGERVIFSGYEGEPEPESKIAKKKIFEAVSPDLKTNADGICVWKDAVGCTSAGPIKASKGMPDAQVA
jgi:aminoacyl tRNA synthase complex-interacting multifunctional protein 1